MFSKKNINIQSVSGRPDGEWSGVVGSGEVSTEQTPEDGKNQWKGGELRKKWKVTVRAPKNMGAVFGTNDLPILAVLWSKNTWRL